ncbi:hypothetical protein [Hymenobacter latericus]|uniref:hypothetical protein n=1 Tax=Hymenobacter sp. YIM 151858-1 TaxID=2987688 RepID=UPI002227FCDE|nr:hypothetical protein [Hymenobacter sp. YIM 151858-1]UYZ58677.1 hypothetical protein OIS50_16635 [Hymenobacter sp. YIM 151858-1]
MDTPKLPRIVENSPLARVARWKLRQANVAMVLGRTIHLSGVSRADFLRDASWVAHELCHIRQVQEHGLLGFLWKYLVESARVGYYANRFEAEAREAGRRDAAQVAAWLGLAPPKGPGRGGSEPASATGARPDVVV